MSICVNTRASFLAVTMLAGWVALATPVCAADNPESEQVSSILSDARMEAFQLKEDAGIMESYTHSKVNWESHAVAIDRIREDINKMGKYLAELQDSRKDAAPWQQNAIDHVVPVAKELANNTTAAIEALNKNPRHLNDPAYQEYVEAIYDSANNLASTIADFTDYGKTKSRLERLSKKLEVPNGGM